jgi:uncharacterized membrane protein
VRSIDRRRLTNWISVGGLGVFIGAVVVAYPFALAAAMPRFGVSGTAAALLALAAISFALPSRHRSEALRLGAVPSVGIPILLAAAVFSGHEFYLQLVPSAVYLALAGWFCATLRSDDSIVERMARFMVPEAPDFIRPYCRKVTGLWAIFFAASAVVAAAFVLAENRSWWEFFTGKLVFGLMIAVSLVEFLVRKTWFRYYFHGGWFDRLWGRLFPPENTPEGRRSMQHISDYWREHDG